MTRSKMASSGIWWEMLRIISRACCLETTNCASLRWEVMAESTITNASGHMTRSVILYSEQQNKRESDTKYTQYNGLFFHSRSFHHFTITRLNFFIMLNVFHLGSRYCIYRISSNLSDTSNYPRHFPEQFSWF